MAVILKKTCYSYSKRDKIRKVHFHALLYGTNAVDFSYFENKCFWGIGDIVKGLSDFQVLQIFGRFVPFR